MSPQMQAPPLPSEPAPALVEVLGKKQPEYTPIEPFVRKDIKTPRVVKPIEQPSEKPKPVMTEAVKKTEKAEQQKKAIVEPIEKAPQHP